jgi:hypothetical protein
MNSRLIRQAPNTFDHIGFFRKLSSFVVAADLSRLVSIFSSPSRLFLTHLMRFQLDRVGIVGNFLASYLILLIVGDINTEPKLQLNLVKAQNKLDF